MKPMSPEKNTIYQEWLVKIFNKNQFRKMRLMSRAAISTPKGVEEKSSVKNDRTRASQITVVVPLFIVNHRSAMYTMLIRLMGKGKKLTTALCAMKMARIPPKVAITFKIIFIMAMGEVGRLKER